MHLARLAPLAVVVVASACGGAESSAPPPAPVGPPPASAPPPPAACAPGAPVCHPDGRAIVSFCGPQATLIQRCAGARGCTTTAQGPTCDESVARAGDADRPSGSAEIAYLSGETIVVERFTGRLPSGLAASM